MHKKSIYTKQYYENFALNVLKKYFPEKFSEFIKSECPDWVCGNVGLEITRAVTTQDGELDAFIKDCEGKEFSEIKKERLRKLGFSTELNKSNCEHLYETRSSKNGLLTFLHSKDDRYIFFSYISRMELIDECSNDIKHAIEEKLKKLNNNYKQLEENDLAILVQEQLNYEVADNIIIDNIVEKLLDDIKSAYSNTAYSIGFDTIYVVFYDNILAVDTKDSYCNRIKISSSEFCALSQVSVE